MSMTDGWNGGEALGRAPSSQSAQPQQRASHSLYWLEQAETDLPDENCWLSANESQRLGTFRFQKRRADWLLGRWTAKNAVALRLGLPLDINSLANIEIRQAPSGVPESLVATHPALVTVSLSHSGGRSICVVGPPDEAIGCDLEVVEPRSDAFFADYFVAEEQALAACVSEAERPRILTLIWSAKESTLKALGTGLRLDTRCVLVSLPDRESPQGQESPANSGERLIGDRASDATGHWRPVWVRHIAGQVFHGWWLYSGRFVRTVVTSSPAAAPTLLAASTTGLGLA
jgi:4'-phosphopantetheinyl transferase